MGNSKMKGKCLEAIEGAVVMTRSSVEQLAIGRNRRFRWESLLPKRKAWFQTLSLLPFALPVGNFLGASWNFSLNLIVEDQQYIVGILSMVVNLILPSLFFACLFHWGWFIWKQESPIWYPRLPAFKAGATATLIIATSFWMVELFNDSLGVCGNPGWDSIGQAFLCSLNNYGFESKPWFGAWFIVAAYCYQAHAAISLLYQQIFHHQKDTSRYNQADQADFTSVNNIATTHGDLGQNDEFRVNPVIGAAKSED
jgi:hypothetical protein